MQLNNQLVQFLGLGTAIGIGILLFWCNKNVGLIYLLLWVIGGYCMYKWIQKTMEVKP